MASVSWCAISITTAGRISTSPTIPLHPRFTRTTTTARSLISPSKPALPISADGKSQAGMGVDAADYDCDGLFDVVKTNFAGDTIQPLPQSGQHDFFEDQTFQAGLGRNTRFLGWGAGFLDYDNDGWPDILLCNGHVYPEVRESAMESGYRQRKVVYRNLGNGRFEDVSIGRWPGITRKGAWARLRVRRFR